MTEFNLSQIISSLGINTQEVIESQGGLEGILTGLDYSQIEEVVDFIFTHCEDTVPYIEQKLEQYRKEEAA